MLGHCGRSQQPMITTAIRQIFNADTGQEARERLADVVDRLQTPAPKVAGLLEQAEEELLAFYEFPRAHWTKLRSTNPLERVNKEIGRRSDVLGIYPNDRALIRLAGMSGSNRTTSGSSNAATSQTTPSAKSFSARQIRTSWLEQQHQRGRSPP